MDKIPTVRIAWLLRWEPALVVAACTLGFAVIPLMLGQIGLSWDALNHHIYLGWVADQARFDRDYLAASYQSYQYPYLYWPVYRLAASGADGVTAGVALALLHVLAVPAVWLLAKTCIPGQGWFELAMRSLAVAMAFISGLVLSLFDSTSNDLLAATPMIWAMAIALAPFSAQQPAWLASGRAACLSGALGGVAIACKLSNVPLFVLLPLFWGLCRGTLTRRARLIFFGLAGSAAGFLVAYGDWGWQLWQHFGNPLYPFLDGWFAPLRAWTGWAE